MPKPSELPGHGLSVQRRRSGPWWMEIPWSWEWQSHRSGWGLLGRTAPQTMAGRVQVSSGRPPWLLIVIPPEDDLKRFAAATSTPLGPKAHFIRRAVRPPGSARADQAPGDWGQGRQLAQACLRTAPSIRTPAVAYFQSATSSLRARATIIVLPRRPPLRLIRSRYHTASADCG